MSMDHYKGFFFWRYAPLIIVPFILAIYGGILYVAYHFIAKYW